MAPYCSNIVVCLMLIGLGSALASVDLNCYQCYTGAWKWYDTDCWDPVKNNVSPVHCDSDEMLRANAVQLFHNPAAPNGYNDELKYACVTRVKLVNGQREIERQCTLDLKGRQRVDGSIMDDECVRLSAKYLECNICTTDGCNSAPAVPPTRPLN